jgi:uncharacterized membrane protein
MGKTTDVLFRIGLIVKGVDSLFEVAGGILLMMPTRLARYITVIAEHEVYRHHEALAGRLDNIADSVEMHASMGEAVYLLLHGLAKVILIAAVFKGKRWGYTGLIGVLSFFALVELTRAITAHEVFTALFAALDVFVVVLISKEYRALPAKEVKEQIPSHNRS